MYTLALDSFKRYQEIAGFSVGSDWEHIIDFCEKMNIGYDTLFTKSRKQEHIRYRSLFFNWVGLSHVELARMFDIHHSSVMHLRQAHKERLLYDKQYKILHRRLNS